MWSYLKGILSAATVALLSIPTCALADPTGSGWQEIFRDDFSGTRLDITKWSTCYPWSSNGCNNVDNGDLQWYQNDDVLVGDGLLRLRAQRRTVNGYNYTSGMISSHGKFNFQYGYAEMRAKMPLGRGFWANFWMSPEGNKWPPEIDVSEYLGLDPFRLHGVFHYRNSSGVPEESAHNYAVPDLSADFHTFAVKWEPQRIVWFVDGIETRRYEAQENIPAEPMYLMATLSIAPAWTNTPPDETTPFPSYMTIDYIKVWRYQ